MKYTIPFYSNNGSEANGKSCNNSNHDGAPLASDSGCDVAANNNHTSNNGTNNNHSSSSTVEHINNQINQTMHGYDASSPLNSSDVEMVEPPKHSNGTTTATATAEATNDGYKNGSSSVEAGASLYHSSFDCDEAMGKFLLIFELSIEKQNLIK